MKNFEDLPIWQKSIEVTEQIYQFIRSSKDFASDFELSSQIRRSLISISSNIAEGYERNNNKELIRFLKISKGSAGEARSQLYLALRFGYVKEEEYRTFYNQLLDLSKQLKGFIKYLEGWAKQTQASGQA